MAVIYSAYSSGWTPSGASYPRYYRAWVDYRVTVNPTNVVVTAQCGVNVNLSVGADFTASLAASGGASYSGSGSTVYHSDGTGTTVTLIGFHSWTYPRSAANYTRRVSGSVRSSTGSWTDAWVTASADITIPALDKYTVSYNANGGSGSIADQEKIYGINLTPLSNGTGFNWRYHTLLEWNTAPDGSGTVYPLSGTYTLNEDVVLYAQWKLNAVELKTKVNSEWDKAVIYAKVNGNWVLPYRGFIKLNGEWCPIKENI